MRKWEHDGKAQGTKVIIRPQARERPKGRLLVEATLAKDTGKMATLTV